MASIHKSRDKAKIRAEYVKFSDHFTSNSAWDDDCFLEIFGWVVSENKKYIKVALSLQDGKDKRSPYFSVLKADIVERRAVK